MAPDSENSSRNSTNTLLSALENKINSIATEIEAEMKTDKNQEILTVLRKKLLCIFNLYKEYITEFINNGNLIGDSDFGNIIVDTQLLITEVEEILGIEDKFSNGTKTEDKTNETFAEITEPNTPKVGRTQFCLPPIKLHTFGGSLGNWNEFWENFQILVHNNLDLDNYAKFYYLKSVLFGEPKKLISNIVTESCNYKFALDILKRKYDKKNEMLMMLYEKIRKMRQASNDTNSLRYTINYIFTTLTKIKLYEQNLSESFIIPLVLSKLPKPFVLKLEENKRNEYWTLDLLEDICYMLLKARENSGIDRSVESEYNTIYHNRKTKSESNLTNNICAFCYGEHWSDQCTKYTTLNDRKRMLNGKCVRCLRKHLSKYCPRNKSCYYCKSNDHHRSLCPDKTKETKQVSNFRSNLKNNQTKIIKEPQLFTNKNIIEETTSIIPSFVGKLVNPEDPDKYIEANIVLDTGSTSTYVTTEITNLLNLNTTGKDIKPYEISTFGSENTKVVKASRVKLGITKEDGTIFEIFALKLPIISASINFPNLSKLTANLTRNHKIAKPIEPDKCEKIDLLIGSDYFWNILISKESSLYKPMHVVKTIFGNLITGMLEQNNREREVEFCNLSKTKCAESIVTLEDLNEAEDLRKIWELDTIGIKDDPIKKDEILAMEHFNNTICFKEKRYHIKWPTNPNVNLLPNNYYQCYHQLKSLLSRLKNAKELFDIYNDIISEQLKSGVIEEVLESNPKMKDCHYIPHHMVIPKNKPISKSRVVYNASFKTNKSSVSLNDCLLKGPTLLNDLTGILLRMRLEKYLVVCDIKRAFLQLGIQEEDRNLTRFIWIRNLDDSVNKRNIVVYRFMRVPFGIKTSPFLLCATIKTHLKQSQSYLADKLTSCNYMDNFVIGFDSLEKAFEAKKEMNKIFDDCSMKLQEWKSNNREFNQMIAPEDRLNNKVVNLLGISWNTVKDNLLINYPKSLLDKTITKRIISKRLGQIFDPLGLLCPIILKGKILLKELWIKSKDWDEEIECEYKNQWKIITDDIETINVIEISRYIERFDGANKIELIGFSDASIHAYASSVYLRYYVDGEWKSHLIFAKTRIAPIKSLSIPRLELMGAVITVRCLKFVEKQLQFKISSRLLFTDSKCVIYWFNSEKSHSVFVQNRINEMRKFSDIIIKYVPSLENPADIATKGMEAINLKNCELWWNGPDWLQKDESCWRTYTVDTIKPPESAQNEVRKNTANKVNTFMSQNILENANSPFLIDIDKFSSLQKLLRVTAWCFRFCNNTRKKNVIYGLITAEEKQIAKFEWEKYIQASNLANVYNDIRESKFDNLKKLPKVFIDDNGLIRCCGRLNYSQLSSDEINPKLLPTESKYTELIIRDIHEKSFHSGTSFTLAKIRGEYWIPKGRIYVKKVLKNCQKCKMLKLKPYAVPQFPPFPQSRVKQAPAFSHVGLDYMGPITIKIENSTKKIWVCLYTCLVVRAIHLEIAFNLSADEFLLCHRRFIARRGKPIEIVSDNASQFLLSAAIIKDYLMNNDMIWRNTTPFAPWKGGVYERLIGLTKSCLQKTFQTGMFTISQMQTVLCEIENVLNQRPLTFMDSDSLEKPIVPNDFIILNPNRLGYELKKQNEIDELDTDENKSKIIKMLKIGNKYLNRFWSLWKSQYLLNLRERYKSEVNPTLECSTKTPSIGDIVIVEDGSPKKDWKMAKIIDLIKGDDEEIRSAIVQFGNGRRSKRSLLHLFPMELEP